MEMSLEEAPGEGVVTRDIKKAIGDGLFYLSRGFNFES
jgi:hypothetical protein